MNPFSLVFLLATATGILVGSRKCATLSFLVGCCYMTFGEGLSIAGANLPIVRLLVIAGLVRIIFRQEGLRGLNLVDKLVIAWTAWQFFSSFFHEWAPGSGPKYTAGALLNTTGFYFMIRSLCQTVEDLQGVLESLCLILFPVAVFMVIEQAFQWNVFSAFGGVPDTPLFRNGRFRAQGPFSHAILAGTVGAACLPFAIAIWWRNRFAALIGGASCFLMVYASASSGPIMSLGFAVVAVCLWRFRPLVRLLRLAAIPTYIALSLLMERPPYFLISKINLTGASTGWHRSYLIQQTIKHFDEWWLFGTDRTIHWMPNQGHISDTHTDITNQFIAYAVAGGVVGAGLVILIMWLTFRSVGRLVDMPGITEGRAFPFWCMGASMFSIAASGVSVGYFGQALFFFWLPIAAMASFFVPTLRGLTDETGDSETSFEFGRSPRVDIMLSRTQRNEPQA